MKNFKTFLEEMTRMNLHGYLMRYLKNNPDIEDEDIHEMAEQIGMDPDDLEEEIYRIIHHVLTTLPGKHMDVPDDKFDAEQLAMGIDVEKEHTDNPLLAKEIAKDHLAELPDYYTRLAKMEADGKAELGMKEEG